MRPILSIDANLDGVKGSLMNLVLMELGGELNKVLEELEIFQRK